MSKALDGHGPPAHHPGMTPEQFRRIALRQPEATEGAHQRHADFRVGGKVFATLGYPDAAWGMVKLTPEQQSTLVQLDGAAFVPVKGTWGLCGCTNVKLAAAKAADLRWAMSLAWRNTAPARLLQAADAKPPRRGKPA